MAEGYFNDGTVNVELGAHVFATPSAARRIVRRAPHDDGHPGGGAAVVMPGGGGILDLEVTGQRVRTSLGDAERYVYEVFAALALSGEGDLGFEDNRGYRHVFGDSVCVGASGEVHAYTFCDMRFDFQSPEKSSEPPWAGVPGAPAPYGGTSTAQNYAARPAGEAGGVTLGVGGRMRIEMRRDLPLREVPRARGARATVPASGAEIRLIVRAARLTVGESVATDVEDLVRSIGAGRLDLTGNGNTFEDVVLESARADHTDLRATSVEWTFVKELA